MEIMVVSLEAPRGWSGESLLDGNRNEYREVYLKEEDGARNANTEDGYLG